MDELQLEEMVRNMNAYENAHGEGSLFRVDGDEEDPEKVAKMAYILAHQCPDAELHALSKKLEDTDMYEVAVVEPVWSTREK